MDRSLLLEVWVLARLAGAAMDEAMADSGLTAREFVLYALLAELEQTTPTELARLSGVPATTISKMLRRMERRGDLAETDNPEDARSRIVHLTTDGEHTLGRAQAAFARVAGDLDASLRDERAQIAWSLERLHHGLRRLSGRSVETSPVRPEDARAHELRYVGRALNEAEAAQVADYIDFIRSRS